MQSNGQFDHAQARAQMPTRHRDGVNHFRPQFLSDRLDESHVAIFQILRQLDLIKMRGVRHMGSAL